MFSFNSGKSKWFRVRGKIPASKDCGDKEAVKKGAVDLFKF
jgi:hypothetical protein